jgi:hypothetical protein
MASSFAADNLSGLNFQVYVAKKKQWDNKHLIFIVKSK